MTTIGLDSENSEELDGWEAAVATQRDIMETFLLQGEYRAARERCVTLKSWEQTLNKLRKSSKLRNEGDE